MSAINLARAVAEIINNYRNTTDGRIPDAPVRCEADVSQGDLFIMDEEGIVWRYSLADIAPGFPDTVYTSEKAVWLESH